MNLEKEEKIIQATRKKIVRRVVLFLIIVLVIGALGLWATVYLKNKDASLPGVFYPNQGRDHIDVGTHKPNYHSNPPTSGNHYPAPAEWGVYQEELPDETLIHNLEHGGIWISYKPGISKDMKEKLESFYQKWGSKVIVTPRAANDTDIALAAWTYLDKFNVTDFSEERVEKFIKAYRNKGPEFVP